VRLAVFPGSLLERAAHDAAAALLQRLGDVVGEVAPAGHVEERRLLLPLAVDLIAAVDGQAEGRDRRARRREAELGVTGEVADDGDGVGHGCLLRI
jgi:hypothetical protein